MTRKPALLLLSAAALGVPARALIPSAADAVKGVVDGADKKAAEDEGFVSPSVRPDPDPFEKYKGLKIKPTDDEQAAHDAWVKRRAAQSEAADTLLENLSEAEKSAAANTSVVKAARSSVARLSAGQFYAYAAGGSAQLYTEAGAIRTSASGLRTLYQTLSEQDRQLALAAAPDRRSASSDSAGETEAAGGRAASSAAAGSRETASSASGADSANLAAQSILGAFSPLEGASKASSAPDGTDALPASEVAAKAGGGAAGRSSRAGVRSRLESFPAGNSGGAGAAALTREGDMPTVKVGGMEDLFNGGSQALGQDKKPAH